MLREALARPLEVPTGRVPLSELYADLVSDYTHRGQRTEDLAKRWRHLEPVFGPDAVEDVTTSRLRRYVDQRVAAKAALATVERELACLRRMLRLGFNATPRKLAALPAFPTIRPNNVRTGFFERADFERVRAKLPQHLRPLATVAYWTGLRRGELIAMRWAQVDLERGTLRLNPGTTKNRQGRVIYLPPEALRTLVAWERETRAAEKRAGTLIPHVFHRDGAPIGFEFYPSWRTACEAAKVPGMLLHDLRRTAARNYVRRGVSEHVAMKILGHKTRSIFDRYNIVSESDLAEAAQRVAVPAPVPDRRKALRGVAGRKGRKG